MDPAPAHFPKVFYLAMLANVLIVVLIFALHTRYHWRQSSEIVIIPTSPGETVPEIGETLSDEQLDELDRQGRLFEGRTGRHVSNTLFWRETLLLAAYAVAVITVTLLGARVYRNWHVA